MPRLTQLLAASCLGPALVLLLGRGLVQQLPPPTPAWSSRTLRWTERLAPDPWRRREAALLLEARSSDPAGATRLAGLAWGSDPLAALVLKLQAQALEQQGRSAAATSTWRALQHRFPSSAARADADYALGRQQPALRQALLQRFPAHPAALAAALEAGPGPGARRQGVLHLAQWGPRWPGAEERIRQLCHRPQGLTGQARAVLAQGLADLGDGDGALRCLGNNPQARAALPPAGQLALARSLLHGDGPQQTQALALLQTLAQGSPRQAEAEAAVRLLAQEPGQAATAVLTQLPARWRQNPAVLARQALDPKAPPAEALALLRRWPRDPALWDLQWELARRALLAGQWAQARHLLEAIGPEALPAVLAARQQFWLGYALAQQGQNGAAQRLWRRLLAQQPGGYYGWRAARRLGLGDLELTPSPSADTAEPWQPLNSGQADLDRLWRLDQRTEAWELWRHRRGRQAPQDPAALLVEGRLRQGVGDDWIGLGQLEQASLQLPPQRCRLLAPLEQALHPWRYRQTLGAAARQEGLALPLLLGVARQESRFSAGVQSPVGAVGLLQLMPATASELAGRPLGTAELSSPATNAALGARYLRQLLAQWQGNPLLAVASYNAGPGAVQGWLGPRLQQEPELWVEAIPYPETRLYVKKVLGNAWSYQRQLQGLREPAPCPG